MVYPKLRTWLIPNVVPAMSALGGSIEWDSIEVSFFLLSLLYPEHTMFVGIVVR